MNDRPGDEDEEAKPPESPGEPLLDDSYPLIAPGPPDTADSEPELHAEPEFPEFAGPEPEPRAVEPSVPVQLAPPTNWPPPGAPQPMGPPLGERPLPELEPLLPLEPEARPRKRRPRRPLAVRLLLLLVKLILLFMLGSVLLVAIYRFVAPPITLTMIGDAIGGHRITKQWMELDRIDPRMARAAIGAEDSHFCSHSGFDWNAMAAAYERNASGKRHIRGGSTISQQTAKNVFLWQGGGYLRKGLEAWFTMLIETIWGKKRIMEVYLNVAETGIGTYGVNAGAQRYFGHDASHLSAQEAAQIAAVLPLPKKRAGIDPQGFTRRYGKSIAARIGVVRNDDLDSCLR